VSDDGLGFDPAAVPADHLGLRIMGERMASVGGRLEIRTRLGGGTRLLAEWTAVEPEAEPEPDAHVTKGVVS
jgi:nitrate/nitrite-specific signal transduction histidine kinase